ncbi:hypothetical protein [Emticicia sp. BO119]|uniref:hypothetical protein n=1 Tax=Emticicia sp. BO119 TaxID=2757768 RepID=UPI0015F024B5|nr:hypothetical protein [Emticicia sp. BO119]MBA4849453.1 hypothetical protein [Emticicia sp. BO119]
MNYQKIRNNIEDTIKQKGLIRENVLVAIDIPRQSYLNMFKRESINLNTLQKFADYLDVPVTFLIDGSNNIITSQAEKDLERKYFKAVELLALNGIKLELGKTKGVLLPTIDPFFLTKLGHKVTHP